MRTYLDLIFVEGKCVDQESGQEIPPNISFQRINPATGKKECGSRVCIVCDEDKGTACYSGQSYVFNKTIFFVKLRERERHRVDQGKKKKKNGWWMVDGGYPFPDALH